MQFTHDEITRLSPDERLALVAQLWDSLEYHQVQLTSARLAELERRLARKSHKENSKAAFFLLSLTS